MRYPCLFLVLLATVSKMSASDDWPQFRGPSGDGHSRATAPPLTFDDAEGVMWKTAIDGRAFSSPVILGDRIWLTTAIETAASPEEAKKRVEGDPQGNTLQVAAAVVLRVVCLDRGTGGKLYDVEVFHLDQPTPIQNFNSYASPTPIIEGGRLYCDFGEYGTACLDAASGKTLWIRRLPITHFVGPGSSPAICDDLLVLVRDGGDQQYVTGLEKQTGKTVWKTCRPPIDSTNPNFRKAFSTPLLIEADGRQQLVIPGAQWGVAYEPMTGKEIWRASCGSGFSNSARPVFGHGMVYICTGFMHPELWAIRVDGEGDVTETHVAWTATKQIPKRSSPILVGDEIYLVSDGGVATCFDAATGKTHWRARLGGDYSASPISVAGRIYFFSEGGDVTVLRPGKAHEVLAKSRVNGRLMATPAFTGKGTFIRTDTHLVRYE